MFFIKSKAENQLKSQLYTVLHRARTRFVKLLGREMPDFIIAPNMWRSNMSNFYPVYPVDNTILAVLQE